MERGGQKNEFSSIKKNPEVIGQNKPDFRNQRKKTTPETCVHCPCAILTPKNVDQCYQWLANILKITRCAPSAVLYIGKLTLHFESDSIRILCLICISNRIAI